MPACHTVRPPKVGDLVKSTYPHNTQTWLGIIVDFDGGEPVVYWNASYPDEVEYLEQIVVVGYAN